MAEQKWRAFPSDTGMGSSTITTTGQSQQTRNGGAHQLGSSTALKFYSGVAGGLQQSAGMVGNRPASPQLASPPGSNSGVPKMQAAGSGSSFPASSSASLDAPPPGSGVPPRQQSPFSGAGAALREVPRANRAGSSATGMLSSPPNYGLGPPNHGSGPPTSSLGQPRYGPGPPSSDPGQRHRDYTSGKVGGPPTGSRVYPRPPSSGAFAKQPPGPPTAFPPTVPPSVGWQGNGIHANGQNGQPSRYPSAPSTFTQPPPPVASPSGADSNGGLGLGPGQNGDTGSSGQVFRGVSNMGSSLGIRGGGTSRMGTPPTPMLMYDAQRPRPPSGGPPGHPYTTQPYSNGGMPGPRANPRPKIEPDQIPRPIISTEVITYHTCTPPNVRAPPTPSSNYIAIDEGNCSPRFMRSTMAQLPITADALSACQIPMAVVVQPMAHVGPREAPVPLVDFGQSGPLRCENCRAYINSYAMYARNGEEWVCNFCRHQGPVPQTYQCPLDGTGLRRDRLQRPELCRGSVDFAVPKVMSGVAKGVYCLRPEQQPIFVFCVDISSRAVETGFSKACFEGVAEALAVIPGGERARVGLMTFDRSLQVYRFDTEGAVSQIVVAADVEDPYAPLPPKDWILPVDSFRRCLAGLMEAIPGLSNGEARANVGSSSACACGAALRAMADCLETIGGRVFLMTQSPPNSGAGMVHAGREEPSLYGGDKEFRMYQPATAKGGSTGAAAATWVSSEFYRLLAKDCAARQISIDLILWSGQGNNREFYDAATIGAVARMTGGRVTYLREDEAGGEETALHLREQLSSSLREHEDSASETVLKVRCTAGVACTQRLGPGVENMPGELELAVFTPSHSIVCRLEHDGRKLDEGRLVFVQAALLYTSTSGQRRVRCHTLGLPVTGLLPSIFKSTDVETVSAVLARQAVSRALNNTLALQPLHSQIEEQMLMMLYSYRKNCAPNSSAGQLILPETLRVLPLFTLCTHKMLALRPNVQGGAPDVRADERATRLLVAHSMSVVDVIKVLYPTLYSIHDLPPDIGDAAPPSPSRSSAFKGNENAKSFVAEGEQEADGGGRVRPGVDVPVALPPTSEKLSSQGVFLLDCGEDLLLYVGRAVGADVVRELFGVDTLPTGISIGGGYGAASARSVLRLVDDEGYEQARRARNVIAHLRRGCSAHKPLSIVVANSGVAEESRFVSLMVEDKTKHGTSYVDQLCQLHRQIQAKMPKS